MTKKAFWTLSDAELELVAGGANNPGIGDGIGGGKDHKNADETDATSGGSASDLTEPMFQQPEV